MKDNLSFREGIVLLLQLGINMMVPIFMCTLFGVWLVGKIGHSWLILIFILVGIIAGVQNCYLPIKRIIKRSEAEKGSREIAAEEVEMAMRSKSKKELLREEYHRKQAKDVKKN